MNALEREIVELKDRVSVLERILMRSPRDAMRTIADVNGEQIARSAVAFVANKFRMGKERLTGDCREWRYVWPRWIAMHLAVKYSGITKSALGRLMNRDNGTVIHGLAGLKTEIELNPELAVIVTALEKEFEAVLKPKVPAAHAN